MSKKIIKNIPKLRFPEFLNDGEWEEETLISISDFINKKIALTELSLSTYISTENLLQDFSGVSISSKLPNVKNVTHFKKNDILVSNIRPYLKKVWFATFDGGASNDVIIIRAKSNIESDFLIYLIKNDKFINYVMESAKGVKMPRGDIEQIKKYPSFIPKNPKEQKKIAYCLNSIDNLISAQNKKLETLQEYKKGLLQNLFPREMEKVPKLRFNEFKNNGEWEEKILDEICDFQDGFAFSSNDFIEKNDNAIQVIRITDINNKNNNSDKVYISDSLLKQNEFKKYIVKKDDLLLSLTGAAGFNFFIWNDVDAFINQRTMKIVSKNDNNKAIELLLEALIHKKINIHGVGQNNNLSKDILKNVSFLAPKPKEQQKIANFLISVDELINLQSQKVEALKEHKKSLLEQLLPTQKD